jgi:hypothetical protein
MTFKRYFFKLAKTFVRTRGGVLKRLKRVPMTFIIPGGKRCTIHHYTCPADCNYATLNKKVTLKTQLWRKSEREPKSFRSRVWRRSDYRKSLHNVLMTNDEIDNCTFEPEAGSLGKHLKANKILEEANPNDFSEKLGKNF